MARRLVAHFKKGLGSNKLPIEWAPIPQTWTPRFFPVGYLKDRIYQEKPRSLITLKKKIEEEIKAIKPDLLKRVMENFQVMWRFIWETLGAYAVARGPNTQSSQTLHPLFYHYDCLASYSWSFTDLTEKLEFWWIYFGRGCYFWISL